MKPNLKIIASILGLFLTSTLSAAVAGATGTLSNGQNSGIYGTRNYKVFIPSGVTKASKAPVVVMLHGCEQTAEEFAKGTRIAEFAEKEKFIVLLPEQNPAYNSFKCWNWVMPVNNSRMGEPQAIIEMLDAVIAKYSANSERVYAAGMSAGASMVSILGNCFPERFKALGSHDGTQYYASYTGLDFAEVVLNGASVPTNIAARTGYSCSLYGGANRPTKMPIIIFHGMNSPLMSPVHAFQIENEFKAFNDLLDDGSQNNSYFKSKAVIDVPDSKTYGYNLYTTTNQENQVLIERYMVNTLGHDWSGGVANLPYNDPKGPDATALIVKFFKRFGL
jgi:poly(hydroxyalkanoate) depolymerase family esterase